MGELSGCAHLVPSPDADTAVMPATALLRPRSASPPRVWWADALATLAGLGLGITLALAISAESAGALRSPGGITTALGRLTGLVGAYGLLIVLLLAARLPAIERVVGQNRVIGWHRLLAPWTLVLIAAHGVLIAVGYAQAAGIHPARQLSILIRSYPWVLAATVGFVLLVAAGVSSYRIARRRLSHETWWVVHLYTYLALALAFAHQIITGASFVGHPVARAWWIALWLGAIGAVLTHRIGQPALRSMRHRLRVIAVERDAPGVVTVILEGRDLDRLPLAGGQFAQWRFLTRERWWQAHPYSLSSLPRGDHIRITVKDLGDHSGGLASLRPGTRVALEGPYGNFTRHACRGDRLLLVGAGVGAAVLPALLEDLPEDTDVVVINRASTTADLVLREEITSLVSARGGALIELTGSRSDVRLDADRLRRLVPDIAGRDVYVCGPDELASSLLRSAAEAGVAHERLHHEAFSL